MSLQQDSSGANFAEKQRQADPSASATSLHKEGPGPQPKRSLSKDILLIGTVTLAMLLNVCASFSCVSHVSA